MMHILVLMSLSGVPDTCMYVRTYVHVCTTCKLLNLHIGIPTCFFFCRAVSRKVAVRDIYAPKQTSVEVTAMTVLRVSILA